MFIIKPKKDKEKKEEECIDIIMNELKNYMILLCKMF